MQGTQLQKTPPGAVTRTDVSAALPSTARSGLLHEIHRLDALVGTLPDQDLPVVVMAARQARKPRGRPGHVVRGHARQEAGTVIGGGRRPGIGGEVPPVPEPWRAIVELRLAVRPGGIEARAP